jgi:hypothetical protein
MVGKKERSGRKDQHSNVAVLTGVQLYHQFVMVKLNNAHLCGLNGTLKKNSELWSQIFDTIQLHL